MVEAAATVARAAAAVARAADRLPPPRGEPAVGTRVAVHLPADNRPGDMPFRAAADRRAATIAGIASIATVDLKNSGHAVLAILASMAI